MWPYTFASEKIRSSALVSEAFPLLYMSRALEDMNVTSVRRLVVLLLTHRYASKLKPDSDYVLLPLLPWYPSFQSLKWW